MENTCGIILAAGDGKRMGSASSKVLCQVLFKPMLEWVMENCTGAGVKDICVVVGKGAEDVETAVKGRAATAVQLERHGTGHAVICAEAFLKEHLDGDVLILYGDAPFQSPEVIDGAYRLHKDQGNAMTVVSATVDDPFGYGRIVRDNNGVSEIVEQKDANDAEKGIREINAGAYWYKASALLQALSQLTPANAQGELYLTDTLHILRKNGYRVNAYDAGDQRVVLGANSRKQLAHLNEIAREMVFESLWERGVDIPITDGIIISREATIGRDTKILPGTLIKGHCTIGEGCVIGPNSMLENAVIGDKCQIKASWITDSVLLDDVQIGPFSQVRPNCRIASGVRVGDFVEIKNSNVGADTHASHLTYIGDTDCGSRVNFGCGVVTVNYNGASKNRTTIGDDCFIGCNTNLVAPVTVGNGAYTAAGSTVTVDVPEDALCIARAREVIKEGRAVQYRKKKD
ncbi:MAG: bifunctional UDP-N-acetylglucosamine diphosphorylase/glucosamine-1-phosphate N-acetyltransferase GlmU [Angelakisella sp.]